MKPTEPYVIITGITWKGRLFIWVYDHIKPAKLCYVCLWMIRKIP